MNEILTVSGVSAGYGPLRVLHDISFTINRGERVGLVGLNGHGKSTLFRTITGLVDWQNGSIMLNGVQIGGQRTQGPGRMTHRIARQGVALMPQGDAMFIGLTVRQHLDAGAFTRKAWSERHKRRERILDIFPPLRKLLNQPVGKLSGGERRMVTLGRGLMGDVKLYLVDEPSLGLAPKISRAVIDALINVDLADGAMVIAEQNLQLLEGCVDRLIGMHGGEIKGSVDSLSLHSEVG
ncbi:MAG: ATP-binding cassette domain-containing protein [Arenicellales bacterium]|jgi:branched-chain amino acid transport system ATP-binding protein|nr:ATP-binding cassette domain-containing protein [Arenicellales bacterium]|tara:strand:- start:1519 stop:2229 length:711 start_codon:yes stop_codon:yes gene_type:complete